MKINLNALKTAAFVGILSLASCSPDPIDPSIDLEQKALVEQIKLMSPGETQIIQNQYVFSLRPTLGKSGAWLESTEAYFEAKEGMKVRTSEIFAQFSLVEGVDFKILNTILYPGYEAVSVVVGPEHLAALESSTEILDRIQDWVVVSPAQEFKVGTLEELTSEVQGLYPTPNNTRTTFSDIIPGNVSFLGGGTTSTDDLYWSLDTGVDQDHPDLNVDTYLSCNLMSGVFFQADPSVDDRNGHGSHTTGVAAANLNNFGIAGVVSATVVGVKVLADNELAGAAPGFGIGQTSDIACGTAYAAIFSNSNDVINASLGAGNTPFFQFAWTQFNNVYGAQRRVCAAGNDGSIVSSAPAIYNGNGLFTVTAINSSNNLPAFASYGAGTVDFAAPGVGIVSTFKDGLYATLNGTSQACPHLSGILLAGGIQATGTSNPDPQGNTYPIPSL